MVRVMQGWELLVRYHPHYHPLTPTNQHALQAVEWSFVVLTLFMVTTRVYVQPPTRRHAYREVFTLTAWLLFVAVATCDSLLNDAGVYDLSGTIEPSQLVFELK